MHFDHIHRGDLRALINAQLPTLIKVNRLVICVNQLKIYAQFTAIEPRKAFDGHNTTTINHHYIRRFDVRAMWPPYIDRRPPHSGSILSFYGKTFLFCPALHYIG